MLATTVTQKEISSTGQKEEFAKHVEQFQSEVASLNCKAETDYGFWRKNNAESMRFSEMPVREFLRGVQDEETILVNKLGSAVVSVYMGRSIEGDNENKEGTITMVARVDAWMYVMVMQLAEDTEEA